MIFCINISISVLESYGKHILNGYTSDRIIIISLFHNYQRIVLFIFPKKSYFLTAK